MLSPCITNVDLSQSVNGIFLVQGLKKAHCLLPDRRLNKLPSCMLISTQNKTILDEVFFNFLNPFGILARQQ